MVSVTNQKPLSRQTLRSLGVKPDALGMWLALQDALADTVPPCAAEPELWWSTDLADVAVAVAGCWLRPAQRECGSYAVAADEKAGTWGGENRGYRRQMPCDRCGANGKACNTKLSLSGRRCCEQCTHAANSNSTIKSLESTRGTNKESESTK